MGADTLPADLSSPRNFTLEFFSSGLGEGYSLGGSVSSAELFASRVVEEQVGRTSQAGGSSPPSFEERSKGVHQVRKKSKSIRKKWLSSLAIGDEVSME